MILKILLMALLVLISLSIISALIVLITPRYAPITMEYFVEGWIEVMKLIFLITSLCIILLFFIIGVMFLCKYIWFY